MAPPASRIYDVCADVLGAVIDRHGAPLPDRAYVSAGPPAWDCELLATWCETTAGQAGNAAADVVEPLRSHAGHTMRTGVFVVTLVRCTPALPDVEGDQVVLPSTDEEQAAARELYEDAQRVLNALVAAEKAGELPTCNGMAFAGWNTLGPEGGLVAGELRVRIGLATGL
jgi:hypothetical protein